MAEGCTTWCFGLGLLRALLLRGPLQHGIEVGGHVWGSRGAAVGVVRIRHGELAVVGFSGWCYVGDVSEVEGPTLRNRA
jgi:hypothetical protein